MLIFFLAFIIFYKKKIQTNPAITGITIQIKTHLQKIMMYTTEILRELEKTK